MFSFRLVALAFGIVIGTAAFSVTSAQQQQPPQQQKAPAPRPSGTGWQLPPEAETTKNPLTVDAKLLETGKGVFKEKCQRCHGPGALGDGPDADPEHAEDMNLTNPRRAARNTDGVVFFKVWNGRKEPKMPAMKDELSRDQVWAVVAYVQSLRKRS